MPEFNRLLRNDVLAKGLAAPKQALDTRFLYVLPPKPSISSPENRAALIARAGLSMDNTLTRERSLRSRQPLGWGQSSLNAMKPAARDVTARDRIGDAREPASEDHQQAKQVMETTTRVLEHLSDQDRQAKQTVEKAKQTIDQIGQHSKHLLGQSWIYEQATKKTRQDVETARQHWMDQLKQVMDGLNQAPQALEDKQALDKIKQDMETTRQDTEKAREYFGQLKQSWQDQQYIQNTIQDMERSIKDMNGQLKQARQAKQNMDKHGKFVETTIKHFESLLKQAPQAKQAMDKIMQGMEKNRQNMDKIIQGMEKNRQHWMDQLEQALENKQAMDTTIRVIDKIIQTMDKTRPCLERRFNQAPQDKQAMNKTRQDMETITQKLEQEVNEIRTNGENWKKQILFFFTGGTIGSVRLSDGTMVQPSDAIKRGVDAKDIQSLLLNAYEEQHPIQYLSTVFKTETLMEILSEDITKGKMKELTEKLKEINFANHDGIVLTHGSDTLGDTANYLAMILPDIKVPMILVSSHFPVTDERANGVQNLKGALDFISNVKIPGVYITYHSKGETKVMYGSRVLQCDNITDEFMSISADEKGEKTICPLGVIKENGNFEVSDQKFFEELKGRRPVDRPNLLDSVKSLDARIKVIKPWLGEDYNTVNLDNVDAVLHLTHHSGTARTLGSDNENLLALVEKCQEKGIDLYLLMYGKAGRDVYSSTAKYCDKGGLTIMNLSEEAARMKLLIAYSLYPNDKEKRKNFIYEPINEEFIGPDTSLERGSQSSVKLEELSESSSSQKLSESVGFPQVPPLFLRNPFGR